MKPKLQEALKHAAQRLLGLPILVKQISPSLTVFRVEVVCPSGEKIDIGMVSEYNGGLTQGRSRNPTLAKLISAVHNDSLEDA